MARHQTFTLDPETAAKAASTRTILDSANVAGQTVAFTVEGRDTHELSDRSGTVIGFAGIQGMSNETVLVETDKGTRSFNVWLIRSIQVMGE